MRGKGQRPRRGYPFGGITPAHAGKRGFQCQKHGTDRDHPRTCGEKLLKSIWIGQSLGSPPRMRGKVVSLFVLWFHDGITPAHAGKRQAGYTCFEGQGDHPRACGEKTGSCRCSRLSLGSPPRMRGKAFPTVPATLPIGITPAHAGKSYTLQAVGLKVWDHPRACGEKFILPCLFISILGSPPRMRGKAVDFFILHKAFGITPAHAGKRCTNTLKTKK